MKQKISWSVVFAVAMFAPVAMALGQAGAPTGGANPAPGGGTSALTAPAPITAGAAVTGGGSYSDSPMPPMSQGKIAEMMQRYGSRGQSGSGQGIGGGMGGGRMMGGGSGGGISDMMGDGGIMGMGGMGDFLNNIPNFNLARTLTRAAQKNKTPKACGVLLASLQTGDADAVEECQDLVGEEAMRIMRNNPNTSAQNLGVAQEVVSTLQAALVPRPVRVAVIMAIRMSALAGIEMENRMTEGEEDFTLAQEERREDNRQEREARVADSEQRRRDRATDRASREARIAEERRTQDNQQDNTGSRNSGNRGREFPLFGGPQGFSGEWSERGGFPARRSDSSGQDQRRGYGYGQQMSNQMSPVEMKRQFEEGQANVPAGQRMLWNDSMATSRQGDSNSRSYDEGRSQGFEGRSFSWPTNPMTPEQQRAATVSGNYQLGMPSAVGGALMTPPPPSGAPMTPTMTPTIGDGTLMLKPSVIDTLVGLWEFLLGRRY